MFKINYKSFVLLPATILCVIAPFIYKAGFDNTQYFEQSAFIIPMIGSIAALVLSILPFIGRYGSVVMFLASFTSLLSFVKVTYLYLSSVFFGGVPETLGGILEQVGFNWSFCIFAYVGAMLLGIVTMFLPNFAD